MSFRLETNVEQVVTVLISQLDALRDSDKLLREAALNATALITNRVQNRGELAAGGKIGGGRYSAGYARTRRKEGRQTGFIDLTMTGQMLDNFTVAGDGKSGYVVGFATDREGQKADWQEAYFGKIFILSPTESKEVLGIIRKRLDALFSGGT